MTGASTTTASGNALAWLASLSPLDWLLLAVTIWSIVRGFLHGAIQELFTIAASLLSLLTAYWQYSACAVWLEPWVQSTARRSATAFLLVAFGVFLVVVLVGRVVRALAHVAGLGLLDRLAGAGLGIAQAALMGTILITALSTFLPSHAWIDHSRLARYFAGPAKLFAQAAPLQLEQRIVTGVTKLGFGRNSLP